MLPLNSSLFNIVMENKQTFILLSICLAIFYPQIQIYGKVLFTLRYTWQSYFDSQVFASCKLTLNSYLQDAILMNQNFAL